MRQTQFILMRNMVSFSIVFLLLAVVPVTADAIISDFDSGNEGWVLASIVTSTHNPSPATSALPWDSTFGKPAGSVNAGDVYGETYIGAPSSFLGNRSFDYGEYLIYDIYVRYTDSVPYPAVVLVGTDYTLYYTTDSPTTSVWTNVGIHLTEKGWRYNHWRDGRYATEAEFRSVLGNLQGLYVLTEWKTGPDDTHVDNIMLGTRESKPVPLIKANGEETWLTMRTFETLTVTLELEAGIYSGDNADWWVLARTSFPYPDDWYYYSLSSGWVPGQNVTYQGPLVDLPPYTVLSSEGMPAGDYTFCFGVDTNMNGFITWGALFYDCVEVEIW